VQAERELRQLWSTAVEQMLQTTGKLDTRFTGHDSILMPARRRLSSRIAKIHALTPELDPAGVFSPSAKNHL
jgi:hypothetical protein